ncbi:MAG: glycosyltransferase [Nitrososphaerota archaeon]|nr:glycosyltransferase [Nitrososphaerota archaeon]
MRRQKGENPAVSIIIATYKRGNLLSHVLEALTTQTNKDFEILMVVKPSEDGTEQVIEKYRERLKIKVIIQNHGYVTDALNLGLKNAEGKIIVFLDDDAIPFPNLIESYLLSYSVPEVGGVAGDVVPVVLRENKICKFKDTPSEIVLTRVSKNVLARKLVNRPLRGLEDYLIYISKAGLVSVNYKVAASALSQPVNSLLAKGANMSISSEASAGFQFPTAWVLGLTFEQYLGWYLWKKGYRIIFNPEIKAYHINHGQSLSRNIKEAKKRTVLCTENRLLFYRLYGSEPDLSIINRIVLLLIETIADIKGVCLHKDTSRIGMFKDKVFAELIGLRWLIYKKLGLNYSPLTDLKKILQ